MAASRQRLNKLADVFVPLLTRLQTTLPTEGAWLINSMPIKSISSGEGALAPDRSPTTSASRQPASLMPQLSNPYCLGCSITRPTLTNERQLFRHKG
jgi:hypothetical protein